MFQDNKTRSSLFINLWAATMRAKALLFMKNKGFSVVISDKYQISLYNQDYFEEEGRRCLSFYWKQLVFSKQDLDVLVTSDRDCN